MPPASSQLPAVRRSVWLYERLLGFYPSGFRRQYGAAMAQVFGDLCRRACLEGGLMAVLVLWVRTSLDLFKTVIEEHLQRGETMTRMKFIQLSSWALVMSSLAMIASNLASQRPEYNRYVAGSLPIDRYLNALVDPLIFLGLILVITGVTGLRLRIGEETGAVGRNGLAFGILSGLVSLSGAIVGLVSLSEDLAWYMFSLGLMGVFVGLAIFGAAALSRKLLPTWVGILLQVGFVYPILLLIVVLGIGVNFQGETPFLDAAMSILFVTSTVGMLALGITTLANRSQKSATAAA